MPLTEISTIFLKHGYFQNFSVLFQLFFSALDCDQIQIMLCCFACQQGHFWSFILLIPTGGPCILNSKVSTHFCLLARVCQHTFFLTHSTLNYNSTKMLAKSPFSQSASYTRMSLRYSLTELISFFFYHCNIYDYLIQTFLFNSMSSPFSCLVPYFWLLFSIST